MFSHGTNKAKGVAILFQRHFPVQLETSRVDSSGRYLVAELVVQDFKFLLINTYAPNEDETFFTSLFEVIENRQNDSMIFGGDFNTTLDPEMDLYNNIGQNHIRKRAVIQEFMENKGLVDVWRIQNPTKQMYTWRKPETRELVMSRLDYFLVSTDWLLRTNFSEIKAKVISDHSRAVINLDFASVKRGKGFWKFNNLLLKDQNFLDLMNNAILKYLYEVKRIEESNLCHQWEQLKTIMSDIAKNYSKSKAKEKSQFVEKMENKILHLDNKLIETDDTELQKTYRNKIKKTEQFLLDEYDNRVNAACFHSKAQYYLKGEKNSSYFFNLEKARYNSKIISRLVREDGSIINDPQNILREERIFYERLYAKKTPKNWPYVNESDNKLSEEEKLVLEKDISELELSNALLSMANSKTPGCDGLSANFYKVFWVHLKGLFSQVVSEIMSKKELFRSAKKGIITLLPKKEKDLLYLQNWRPLTLLNVDYKIISKALALRIKPKLNFLISEDQTGFMQGRNISHTLRTVMDVIQISKDRSLEMVLVSMDWQKCFDNMTHKAIDEALGYFNFGPKFRDMINIMLTGQECCVLNNGYYTDFFETYVGAKQGANLSPILYILLAEILSINIRNNSNIKGIKLGETERKLAQFADDMNAFLKFEKITLMEFVNEVVIFEEATGLIVNYNKTNIYRIGSLANTDAKIITKKPFVWTCDPIKVLGIYIDYSVDKTQKLNTNYLLERVENVCELWHNRNLTLTGKVMIINSLCASIFVYRMAIIRSLSKDCIDRFNNIIKKFLWNNGRAKISLDRLCNSKEYGGLKLINLEAKDKALKLQWVANAKEFESIKELSGCFLPPIGQAIFMCNFSPNEVSKFCKDSFWSDVLKAWAKTYFCYPDNPTKIAAQVIWHNSYIKVAGKTMYISSAHRSGILFMYNIWNKIENRFLSYDHLTTVYGQNALTHLQYFGLISAIPKEWVRELKNTRFIIESFTLPYENFNGKVTHMVYDKLVSKQKLLLNLHTKWNTKLNINMPYELFLENFVRISHLTFSTKMRNFQYRFLHQIIFCGNTLYKWKLIDSPLCTYCKEDYETIEHLFFACQKVKRFWEMMQAWFESLTDTEVEMTPEIITFCNHEDDLYNSLILIAKQHIFSKRCLDKELSVYNYKEQVMQNIRIERYHALQTKRYKPFVKKWNRMFNV